MSPKGSEKKTPSGYYNSHYNGRRKRRDFIVSNCSNSNGSSSTICNKHYTKTNNRDDPGALILKLLHSGRNIGTTPVAPQSNNLIRPQSRTKNCENVELHLETQSEEPTSIHTGSANSANAVNLFATPPPNRKGRYSAISSCGTNNSKMVNCSNSDGNKSLPSSSSNPTNFALPMYMRSPNPESIPMPCGFPIG